MYRKSRAVCKSTIILEGTTQLPFLGSSRQSRRRFHYFICVFTGMTVKTWNGLYRMSRLRLIAAIPGKDLTNRLLLRWAAECVTVTREDECLTSNKTYSFFTPSRARGDMAEICAMPYLCALKHVARKKWTSNYTQQTDGQWLTPSDLNWQAHSSAILLSDWYRVDYGDRKNSLLKMNNINKYSYTVICRIVGCPFLILHWTIVQYNADVIR